MIKRKELIKKYIDFFKDKGHVQIKNASLVPENDSSVLFTTAGMHPLVPFLLGEPHPNGKRLCNVQRCIRTGDIEEVGDSVHHTFFEMLGNWSLGDYFKEDAIKNTFEFLTKVLEIPKGRLAVTVFQGDKNANKDVESEEIWKVMGFSSDRIAFLPKEDNWWETSGAGPCGPDTEIFYWKLNDLEPPQKFDPSDKNWVEIGNNVLMQYRKDKEGNYHLAEQKNIDFGGGVERTLAILNGYEDNYETEIWKGIIKEIEEVSGKNYSDFKKEMRIVADHIKASVFILAEEITPSNVEQGYVLRRLIRRAFMNMRKLGLKCSGNLVRILKPIFEIYEDYSHLEKNKKKIINEIKNEEERFEKTLEKGLKEFDKMVGKKKISGKEAFLLFQSYGFPVEMTLELAKEKGVEVDLEGYLKEEKKHQELSRTASSGKFKSGLLDNSEHTKRLHTATHILNQALRIVLNDSKIYQKGSNITPERLRFDFNFNRKLTKDEIDDVESLVNRIIGEELPVHFETMSLEKAKETGAQGVFDEKYESEVKVYFVGSKGDEFSKEICAGPHVENTKELGHFRILKEESSSQGVRRIKAILE
jgi:alanyl-tRNA synthetase